MRAGQDTGKTPRGSAPRLAIRPRLEYKSNMIFLLFPLMAQALTFEVIGACKAEPVRSVEYSLADVSNAGKVSVEIFEKQGIPYIGSELGFNSILETPVGRDAIEIPAPGEIRAYGWCYEVNGLQPDGMPNEIPVSDGDHLLWFYAFALHKNGEWVSYCTPAHTVKPAKLCP